MLKFLALATLRENLWRWEKHPLHHWSDKHWCNQVGVPTQLGWPNDPRITRKTTIDNTIVDQRTYLHNLVAWKVGYASNSDHAQIWMKLDHFVKNDQRSSDSLTQYKSTKNNCSDDDAINFANKTTAIICKNKNKLNDIDETCCTVGQAWIQAALECKLIKQVKTTNKKRFQQIKQNKHKIEKTIKQLKILMNFTQQQKQQLVTLCRQRNIISRKLWDIIKQKKIKSWESYLQRLDERNCNGTKVMKSRQAWDRIRKINGSTKRKNMAQEAMAFTCRARMGIQFWTLKAKCSCKILLQCQQESPTSINCFCKENHKTSPKLCQQQAKITVHLFTQNDVQLDLENITDKNGPNALFKMHELEFALDCCGDHTAPGIDGITYKLIRHASEKTKKVVVNSSRIFFKTMENCKNYSIPNKEINYEPKHYRLISLLTCVAKILERMIARRMSFLWETKNLLPFQQEGFWPGRSTERQLVKMMEQWTHTWGKQQCFTVCVWYWEGFWYCMDCRRPLYKIHKLLGDVLEQSTITWFYSDLTERKGVVCINKTQSESVTFESGVPQGGALSPLLHIIFVNDLVNQPKNSTTSLLFADDTALLIEIDKDLRIDQVQNQSQEDLNKINTWFRYWRIRLFTEKTKFRILSKQKNRQANNFRRHLTFRVGDHEAVEDNDPATRDLGIWLDDHLTYNEHIQKVVSVGKERINLLKNLANKNLGVGRETLLNTYIMWLRPVLKYGSILFGMAPPNCFIKLKMSKLKHWKLLLAHGNQLPEQLLKLRLMFLHCIFDAVNLWLTFGHAKHSTTKGKTMKVSKSKHWTKKQNNKNSKKFPNRKNNSITMRQNSNLISPLDGLSNNFFIWTRWRLQLNKKIQLLMNHLGKDVSSLLMISRTGPSNSKTEQQKREALESTYQKINRYVDQLTNDDFIVFCDSSATPPPSGDAVHGGCWMNNQKHTIETWSISMNVMCDNMTAELAAIHHTLKTALYKKTKLKQNVHCLVILTDCQTALVDIHSPNNHFANAFTKEIIQLIHDIRKQTPMSNLAGSLVMQTTNAMNFLICWQRMLHTLKQRMAVWLAIAKKSTWILKTKVKTLPISNPTTDITSTVFKTIWPQLITLSLIPIWKISLSPTQ